MSKKIQSKIDKNKLQIMKLLNENIDLNYELNLKKFSRFSEKTSNFGTRRKPNMVTCKIGHYFQYFTDEEDDNKGTIKIERSEVVEFGGLKCDDWRNPLKYYTIDNL